MKLPDFLSQKENSLIYNGDGEFLFYVPESYFGSVKQNPIAQIVGYYVSTIGILDWAIVDKNGKVVDSKFYKSVIKNGIKWNIQQFYSVIKDLIIN